MFQFPPTHPAVHILKLLHVLPTKFDFVIILKFVLELKLFCRLLVSFLLDYELFEIRNCVCLCIARLNKGKKSYTVLE